ncbi:hypothetical protein UFOVP264_60, partial [uncultured Caudovirales phage]
MFEKLTKIDNSREVDGPREKHQTIELSDKEHMERLQAATKLVYRPPPPVEEMSPEMKKKYEKAVEITKENNVIKLNKGKKNVRKKNQASKKSANKANP